MEKPQSAINLPKPKNTDELELLKKLQQLFDGTSERNETAFGTQGRYKGNTLKSNGRDRGLA